jgi:hypothetical protein
MFDLKMIKLDYSTLYAKWSEEIITSDKSWYCEIRRKMNIIIRKQEQQSDR